VAYGHRLEVPIRTTAPDVSVIREPVYCLDLYGVAPWAMLDGRMVGRLDQARRHGQLAETLQ
jgi:formate dehydrogenase subunit gamma